MSKGWTFAAGVTGACSIAACALVTHFDAAVTPDGGTSSEGGGGCASMPSAILCEDFESGSGDGKWTTQNQTNGSWTIVGAPEPVHSGHHSLHLHADESPDSGNQTVVDWEKSITPASWSLPLYLRAFVYWTPPLANQVANFLQLQNRSEGFVFYGGTDRFGWTDWGNGTTRQLQMGPTTGVWKCVEWRFEVGTTGTADVQVFTDGMPNQSLEDNTAAIFPFTELDVGLQIDNTGGEPAMDLYVDDVVLASQPIGCD
jgi:hypothetical protein